MQNITPLVSAVEKAIAAHESVLEEAQTRAAAERDALAARQAQDTAKLSPIAEARAALRNTLGELTNRRDVLTEELRIGRHQLTCQRSIADEFQSIATRNFGHEHAEKNPGVFLQLLESRPHGLLALLVIPWLEKWLVEKQEALEETENQIAELAKSAKPPTK
jgi:hypothetical protein